MKTEISNAEVKAILDRPYSWVVRPDEAGGFSAKVAEFPGCFAEGETAVETFENLREAADAWVRANVANGRPIPDAPEQERASGRVLVRMPRSLHRRLTERAATEGASLNQFIVTTLAEAIAPQRWTTSPTKVTYLNEPVAYLNLGTMSFGVASAAVQGAVIIETLAKKKAPFAFADTSLEPLHFKRLEKVESF